MTTDDDFELRAVHDIFTDYLAGVTYRTYYGTPHRIVDDNAALLYWLYTDINTYGVALDYGASIWVLRNNEGQVYDQPPVGKGLR